MMEAETVWRSWDWMCLVVGRFLFSTVWTQMPAASSRTVTVWSPVGLARE